MLTRETVAPYAAPRRGWPWMQSIQTMFSAVCVVVCLAFCAGFLATPAGAQLTTSSVVGTVTDPSGAVVPGAQVTITNVGTRVTAKTVTNGTGDYTFNLLGAGQYSVTVQAKGFKKVLIPAFQLVAAATLRENAHLQTGSVEETVTVSAAPPLMQTDTSSVTSVVTERSVQDLPLNGRNYINLVQAQPGVTPGQPTAISSGARPDDRRETSTVSANGQSDLFNNEMLDGMDNNEREQGFIGVRPSIDAIAEVVTETNNFDAEIGRSAGAVVNIITKSGTNAFHGSAYDYFRNDIFDARDFFARQGVTPKPEYRQNQFGGSLGGPIRKDKTFFFADVEDDRNVQGLSSGLLTVPTLFEEQNPGNFSDVGGPVVPPGSLDPVGLAYFKMFPAPNVSSTAASNNYTNVVTQPQTALSLDARIDQHFHDGDTLFGRYSYNNVNTNVPGWFPAVSVDGVNVKPGGNLLGFPGDSITTAHNVDLSYDHAFTPNLLLELKTGYTRVDIDTQNLNSGVNVSSAIGLVNANTPAAPQTTGLTPTNFLTGGYANLGDSIFTPIIDVNNTFQYMGVVTWTHGAHNIKIGSQLTRRQLNYFQSGFPLGWIYFAGLSGNSLADMLTGTPLGYIRGNLLIEPGYRAWESGSFAQDDWRVNSRLTLNLGLRYDVYTPITEAHNRYANFDYPALTLVTGAQDPHIGIQTNYKNIAPRIGFSQSFGEGTLLRGGYGISYYPSDVQTAIQNANPPYNYANTCIPCFGSFTWPTLPVPTASSVTNLSGSLNYLPKNFNTASVQQFNLMLQQEFGANVLTVGGIGELGWHVNFNSTANFPDPSGPYPNDDTVGPPPPPPLLTAASLPNVSTVAMEAPWATSNYYALQAVLARRMTKGLEFNANYTWAHGLTDGYVGSANPETGLLPRNPRHDYGPTGVDVRDRLAVTATYALPFAASAHGLTGLAAKGWTANMLVFWQTGQTFTVTDSYANAYGSVQINLPTVTADRPDRTSAEYRVANPSNSNWLNLDAFTPQPAGTPGNEQNLGFYGPHTRRADVSIFKNFSLPERATLQFRAECFNISNTPNFLPPTAVISAWAPGPEHTSANPISKVGLLPGDTPTSAGGFGTIGATVPNINPRQYQFALKLLF